MLLSVNIKKNINTYGIISETVIDKIIIVPADFNYVVGFFNFTSHKKEKQ